MHVSQSRDFHTFDHDEQAERQHGYTFVGGLLAIGCLSCMGGAIVGVALASVLLHGL
jgi:hypothetical protein